MLQDAVLGLNLDGTTLYVGKIREGRMVTRFFHRISANASQQAVLEEIFKAIDRILGDDIVGIGFGAPSVVDVKEGIVYKVASIPSWKEVHLKEILEKRFDLPVHVNNDANAFAAGELHFGQGRGLSDVVGIILGPGLGMGVMSNGRLFLGKNGGVGELGKVSYREANFEAYCSRRFFDKRTSMQELMLRSRAERGDKEARELYRDFGEHLGRAMQVVLYAYDPEVVVFGGVLSGAFSLFKDSMFKSVRESFFFPHTLKDLRIVATDSKSDGATLGAAALYLDSVGRVEEEE